MTPKRTRGRPPKRPEDRRVKLNTTVSVATMTWLQAWSPKSKGAGVDAAIDHYSRQAIYRSLTKDVIKE